MTTSQINVSALVVGRNEAAKLDRCLNSLTWCNEILYADLDSSDNSIDIANKYHCEVFFYKEFGPAGEHTQAELIKKVNNDWVIILDPDEELSICLIEEIRRILPKVDSQPKIGSVELPWQFFLKDKKLKGTVWGGKKWKEILVKKQNFEIAPITHYGRKLKKGFHTFRIEHRTENVLNHFWMDNLKTFVSKHQKYLKDEGLDKYNSGVRTNIFKVLANIPYQFYYSFFTKKGYKDGFMGLFLSIFWSYYTFRAYFSLYKITLKKGM